MYPNPLVDDCRLIPGYRDGNFFVPAKSACCNAQVVFYGDTGEMVRFTGEYHHRWMKRRHLFCHRCRRVLRQG